VPTRQAFDYSLFGLHVRSDLPLPELLAAPPGGQPDVTIRIGEVPAGADPGPGLQATDQGAVLTIDGIARYAIADGAHITIDREPNVPDANVRLYLLGSAMGVLLHQRGLLPLHANAVEIGGKALAFMGASGSGKSTLAAWFHDHGYRIIADDVCAVRFDGERPFVAPGMPRLRLWKEALERSGRQTSNHSRSYVGDDDWDKFDVTLPHGTAVRSEVELAGVYVLGEGDTPGIDALQGVEAAEAVFAHTYRGAFVQMVDGSREHWSACVRLVKSTPVFLVRRRLDFAHFEEQCAMALSHAKSVSS
jgi:hypothetical protein